MLDAASDGVGVLVGDHVLASESLTKSKSVKQG
jgi:hypothetical protein